MEHDLYLARGRCLGDIWSLAGVKGLSGGTFDMLSGHAGPERPIDVK